MNVDVSIIIIGGVALAALVYLVYDNYIGI
jgi:hypothetical protein